MDDAAMREMMGLPMGFGKRRPVVSTASVSVPMSVPKDPEPEPEPVVETEKEPLTVPSGKASPIAEDAVATEEDDDTEEEDPLVDLPLTHQIALKSHSKVFL